MILAFAPLLSGQQATVLDTTGQVVVTKVGANPVPATKGLGLRARDRLGTASDSGAILQMTPKWRARIDEETDVEITQAAFTAKDKESLKLLLGRVFIFSREEEGDFKFQVPTATGATRGTQLVVQVFRGGRTFLQVLEGEVDLANDQGKLAVMAGEAAEIEPGQAPRKTAVIETSNLLQWTLYYPAVVVPEDLGLGSDEKQAFASSLEAYRLGDLCGALHKYPSNYVAVSDGAKLYHAAVELAVGHVDEAQRIIRDVSAENGARRAIERMVAAVLGRKQDPDPNPRTASEAIAESYYQQSRRKLVDAHAAARRATELAPESGFGWARVAELEFSFGRHREAETALDRALQLGPQNAEAHALHGYVLSAADRIAEARAAFEKALELDGRLGNAWLGLGLTKIRQGLVEEGRSDLQNAILAEPTRSFLYSYHGKALSMEGSGALAKKDFGMAEKLDPRDPTPWLYSSIQAQQDGQFNAAITDLQQSLELNDNRQVYRSQFLLDDDRAVRSSNLATVYQQDGMTDLSVREATRAVDSDYTNASAHLFLANSFDALRDPKQVSLRYETAWFTEQLLADLMSPVGGGPLSQLLSQQEYSRLLDTDGYAGNVITEWRDHGYFDQRASASATYGRLSAGLDFEYLRDAGSRPNNASTTRDGYWQFKYQVTPEDVLYTLGKWQMDDGGDLLQDYNNVPSNLGLRFKDKEDPGLMLLGWSRKWKPGSQTLFLGGRLGGGQSFTAPNTTQLLVQRDPAYLQPGFLAQNAGGGISYASPTLQNAAAPPVSSNSDGSLQLSNAFQNAIAPYLGNAPVVATYNDQFNFSTDRRFHIYFGELQHVWQQNDHTLLLGARWQAGEFTTKDELDLQDPNLVTVFTEPAALQDEVVGFRRVSAYAYDFFRATPWLTLIGGGVRDDMAWPDNFRNPPVNNRQANTEKTSGKFGFILSLGKLVTLRGVYTESVGGVTFDESVRLEPADLAGFNQAFRTVISESLVGSVEAPHYRNTGLSAEGELDGRTWWSSSFVLLNENVVRTVGDFDIFVSPIFPAGAGALPAGRTEVLQYQEEVFNAGANHLIGDEWAVGINYRRTQARLAQLAPQIPISVNPYADQEDRATLHQATFTANWNSPHGWFAAGQANWYWQDLGASVGGLPAASPPGDDFWQFDIRAGLRFHHNQREISVGVLNLGNQNYHLDPLDYLLDLPRYRTAFVRWRLSF